MNTVNYDQEFARGQRPRARRLDSLTAEGLLSVNFNMDSISFASVMDNVAIIRHMPMVSGMVERISKLVKEVNNNVFT